MSEPLAQALRISGASLIMLTSIETRTTVWSAGRGRVGADVAALGAAITEAAAEMVRLTASGVEMDDLLVTSPANFHVLRVVDGQVAHLVLDRGTANLAMARREFSLLVADRQPAAALPVPTFAEPAFAEPAFVEPAFAEPAIEEPAPDEEPVDEVPVPAEVIIPEQRQDEPFAEEEPYPVDDAGEALEGEVLPASTMDLVNAEPDLPRLPQRRADAPWADDPTDYQATVPTLPEWLRAAAGGPFMDDLTTLDRVVGGLRRL